MNAIVLYHTSWDPIRLLAHAVGEGLGCRVLSFDRRPDLGMYDLVVLATPMVGLLDPRLHLFAASGQLRGKTITLVSDLPRPLSTVAFAELLGVAQCVGGAVLHPEQFHTYVGAFFGANPASIEEARAFGSRLAHAFPPPTYPRGEAGKRRI